MDFITPARIDAYFASLKSEDAHQTHLRDEHGNCTCRSARLARQALQSSEFRRVAQIMARSTLDSVCQNQADGTPQAVRYEEAVIAVMGVALDAFAAGMSAYASISEKQEAEEMARLLSRPC